MPIAQVWAKKQGDHISCVWIWQICENEQQKNSQTHESISMICRQLQLFSPKIEGTIFYIIKI